MFASSSPKSSGMTAKITSVACLTMNVMIGTIWMWELRHRSSKFCRPEAPHGVLAILYFAACIGNVLYFASSWSYNSAFLDPHVTCHVLVVIAVLTRVIAKTAAFLFYAIRTRMAVPSLISLVLHKVTGYIFYLIGIVFVVWSAIIVTLLSVSTNGLSCTVRFPIFIPIVFDIVSEFLFGLLATVGFGISMNISLSRVRNSMSEHDIGVTKRQIRSQFLAYFCSFFTAIILAINVCFQQTFDSMVLQQIDISVSAFCIFILFCGRRDLYARHCFCEWVRKFLRKRRVAEYEGEYHQRTVSPLPTVPPPLPLVELESPPSPERRTLPAVVSPIIDGIIHTPMMTIPGDRTPIEEGPPSPLLATTPGSFDDHAIQKMMVSRDSSSLPRSPFALPRSLSDSDLPRMADRATDTSVGGTTGRSSISSHRSRQSMEIRLNLVRPTRTMSAVEPNELDFETQHVIEMSRLFGFRSELRMRSFLLLDSPL